MILMKSAPQRISSRTAAMQHLGGGVGLEEQVDIIGVAKGFGEVAASRHSAEMHMSVN